MSEHSISKEKKCWSCSYYVGKRKLEKGFLGMKVICDTRGKCSNSRRFYKDKEVAEWIKCDRYEMWADCRRTICFANDFVKKVDSSYSLW